MASNPELRKSVSSFRGADADDKSKRSPFPGCVALLQNTESAYCAAKAKVDPGAELFTLVAVEDVRLAIVTQRLFQIVHTEARIHAES